ncbi:hypothetical protein HNR39_003294 [Glaciimonas immobilis]|uniref:Uncharacterized protein n=1 Tax=Glaciimonas immobilis TaxID=728004 RepID=A0A840RY38_9BURK|nr:hypothetical protein [Glaciimonas immobilis]
MTTFRFNNLDKLVAWTVSERLNSYIQRIRAKYVLTLLLIRPRAVGEISAHRREFISFTEAIVVPISRCEMEYDF